MKIKPLFPLLLIVLGILFTLLLVSQIPEGAYFSGDAGLKALLSKQLAGGTGRFDLIPPSQQWVQDLWQEGLYSYTPPYAYYLDGRYFIAFPYTFPLVTAPFYKLFGFYGLYVVPLVSTWILWGLFYWVCRLLRFSPVWTALSLGILIFASPFTLYSAMYWEHSLAVCLAFAGLPLILWAKKKENSLSNSVSILLVSLAGVSLGLAAWFRQDLFCLIALMLAIAVTQEFLKWQPIKTWLTDKGWNISFSLIPHPVAFSLSTAIATGLYFVVNKPVYGSFLGIPRIELLEVTFTQKLLNTLVGFQEMGIAFIIFMPIVCFVGFYGLALLFDRQRLKPNFFLIAIYLLSLILLLGISFLVPAGTSGLIPGGKQWGTRFLLILVPILILTTVRSLKFVVDRCQPWLKYSGIFVFSVLLLLSFHKNTLEGSSFLFRSYRNIAPALQFLEEKPEQVIAISHQFVGQALEASVGGGKVWFKVENTEDLSKLSRAMLAENLDRFLYICYPFARCPLPKTPKQELSIDRQENTYVVEFEFLDKKGKYPIYQGSIHAPNL
ncbi:MAG: dolichol-phosphate mannosyltransferase [Xenococcaceae cyanobacterium]